MAPLFNMFKQAAGQWVRIAVPIITILGFFSDAKQFSYYSAVITFRHGTRMEALLLATANTCSLRFNIKNDLFYCTKWEPPIKRCRHSGQLHLNVKNPFKLQLLSFYKVGKCPF